MVVFTVVLTLVVIVFAMLAASLYFIIGPDRLRYLRQEYQTELRENSFYIGLLLVVLVINSLSREAVSDVSWIIGWNITGTIFNLEGTFVAWLQSFANPLTTAYFSFVYVYGYVFLLVFPIVAYAAIQSSRQLRELISAYIFNYGIGLVFYAVFVSYGPRNLLPDLVDSLLYTTYPNVQFLTSIVNSNTNVFPSLHSSLVTTVAIFAYRTKTIYPIWYPVAVFLTGSVMVATMYLGIHWAVDVIAGIVLGGVSVKLGILLADRIDRRASGSLRLGFRQ